jgi:hypothetical protein
MPHERFRLKTLLHAISDDGQRRSITDLPAGSIVMTTGPFFDQAKLVEVRWQDQNVMVFAQDLKERAELVKAAEG